MSEPHKRRISNTSAALMIGTALFYDVLQIILTFFFIGVVLNPFITIWAVLTFSLWFKIKGLSLIKKQGAKKIATLIGSFIIELSPFSFVPTIAIGVTANIIFSWREDLIPLKNGDSIRKIGRELAKKKYDDLAEEHSKKIRQVDGIKRAV